MLSILIGPHKSICNISNLLSELGTLLGLYDARLLFPCSHDGHRCSLVYLNLGSPLTMLSLANLLMVSKLRWDKRLCHSQDFVSVALVMRQIGDEEAIWLMSMVYRLVLRLPDKRSTPSKFLTDACGIAQRTLFYFSRDLEKLAIPTRQCTWPV